jgi:hypothetical protein
MHRPDTIIEIHRERVQDQTAGIFSGDKYGRRHLQVAGKQPDTLHRLPECSPPAEHGRP